MKTVWTLSHVDPEPDGGVWLEGIAWSLEGAMAEVFVLWGDTHFYLPDDDYYTPSFAWVEMPNGEWQMEEHINNIYRDYWLIKEVEVYP